MRTLLLIGIGAGDPDQVTMQAVRALNQVDVFFVMDKGPAAAELTAARRAICNRYITDSSYRFIEVPDPPRDRTAPAYGEAVADWRRRRTDVYEQLVRDELGDDGCGGFLIWGDPSLYDGSLQAVQDVAARGTVAFDYQVIPGISSVQALTARHQIPLNRVGSPIQITTGRLLAGAGRLPEEVDDLVVMLDAGLAFTDLPSEGVDIYWGAYLGTDDEILIAGPLAEVAGRIEAARAEARATKGWIMDTYLLRRHRHRL